MTRCTRAAYGDKPAAISARRKLLRQFRDASQKAPTLAVAYCEQCDRYHIIADRTRYPFNAQTIRILECVAQGYRDTETADIVSMTKDTVEWHVRSMMKRFAALSRPHLVAISISLGLINPNDFVPEQDERIHA